MAFNIAFGGPCARRRYSPRVDIGATGIGFDATPQPAPLLLDQRQPRRGRSASWPGPPRSSPLSAVRSEGARRDRTLPAPPNLGLNSAAANDVRRACAALSSPRLDTLPARWLSGRDAKWNE
jgi:hypothetical protein